MTPSLTKLQAIHRPVASSCPKRHSLGSRVLVLGYALVSYALFLASFTLFVAFLAGLVPQMIVLSATPAGALAVDVALVLVFAAQHSTMVRPWFTGGWTRTVPQPVERATYVLVASVPLAAVALLWQPLPGTAWRIDHPVGSAAIWGLFALGWIAVLRTFLIDHSGLFGLRQAWAFARGRAVRISLCRTPTLYRMVRHPMRLGFLLALWAAPTMTVGRLVAALLLTIYICVALILEEENLVAHFGDGYRNSRAGVPFLLPRPWRMRLRG